MDGSITDVLKELLGSLVTVMECRAAVHSHKGFGGVLLIEAGKG